MSITQSTAGAGGGELIQRARLAAAAENTMYGGSAGELYNALADALASAPPAGQGNGERVRHVKRDTEYEVLGEAEAQISHGMTIRESDECRTYRHLFEGAHLLVYRSLDNGKLWCRFTDEFRDGRFVTLASAPPAPTPEAGATQIAEGCCSAVSPCSHQQRDPATLCAICAKAARLTDQILGAEEARDLAASERISAAQAIYDEWMADYDPHAPDHEVHLFDAMKAAIAVADAHGSARGGEMKHGYQPTRQGSERPDPPKSGSAVIPPRCSAPTPEAGSFDAIELKAREVVSLGLPEEAKWLLASKDQWQKRAMDAEKRAATSPYPPPGEDLAGQGEPTPNQLLDQDQPYGGPGIRDPLVEIVRKPGKEPCGECRMQPGETCDVCGAVAPAPDLAGQGKPVAWRVGNHYSIHVYADDRPVATFHSADDAARAVAAVNAAPAPSRPADRESVEYGGTLPDDTRRMLNWLLASKPGTTATLHRDEAEWILSRIGMTDAERRAKAEAEIDDLVYALTGEHPADGRQIADALGQASREQIAKALYEHDTPEPRFLWPIQNERMMARYLSRADAVLLALRDAPRDGGGEETLETIAEWCEQTFGAIEPARIVSRAAEEMDELRAEPTQVEEAADVVIVLSRYPGLWGEIQRKMKINRARKWRLMGDGTGYHIKDAPPSPNAGDGTQDRQGGGR